jgi:hypothetical protein
MMLFIVSIIHLFYDGSQGKVALFRAAMETIQTSYWKVCHALRYTHNFDVDFDHVPPV